MLHLGDITKISGYTAPITDCVVGGSPCQDLSIAGKRAGLDGERSGLFMEQIRIIKEMRDRDVRENGRTDINVRPRYMVWENVPGAFSSNKGEDFRIVLEETARIKEKDANVPMPNSGKWQTSGCILGDGWSIAWRVLDAQFWGVPQRRRRIALVADFGGHSAHEILFVRKSLHGYSQPSQPQRKATAQYVTRGIGADDRETAYTMKIRSGCDVDAHGKAAGKGALIQTEKSGTLSCVQDQYLFQPVYSVENHPADSRVDIDGTGKVQTLTSRMGTGGGNVPTVMEQKLMEAYQHHGYRESDVCGTLTAGQNDGVRGDTPLVVEPTVFSKSKRAQSATDYETWQESDTANTLNTFDQGDVRTNECVCYSLDPLSSNSMKSSNPHSGCHETDVARTIDTTNPDPSKNQGGVAVVQTLGFDPSCSRDVGQYVHEDMANTLTNGSCPGYHNGVAIAYTIGNGQVDQTDLHEKAGTLNCMHDQQAVMIAETCAEYIDTTHADDVVRTDDVVAPLQARDFKGGKLVRTRYTVRRLTPLECERLQGYPDGWTDIGEYIDSKGKKKQSSDAARYKALGNSIALPPWKWVMKRLCACYERDATLASLFDGIGGFPYIWEQINGKGSCLWASEIEDFPMAVTKVRICE